MLLKDNFDMVPFVKKKKKSMSKHFSFYLFIFQLKYKVGGGAQGRDRRKIAKVRLVGKVNEFGEI